MTPELDLRPPVDGQLGSDLKQQMLAEIGAASIAELFEQIPAGHRLKEPLRLPLALRSELELRRHLTSALAEEPDLRAEPELSRRRLLAAPCAGGVRRDCRAASSS